MWRGILHVYKRRLAQVTAQYPASQSFIMNSIKTLVFLGVIAAVYCIPQGYGGHGHETYHASSYQNLNRAKNEHEEVIHVPSGGHYKFDYSVKDPHTGDIKTQEESGDGHVVKGYYTLKEADGTVRVVHYNADKHNGFNAKVERQGHAVHEYNSKHY